MGLVYHVLDAQLDAPENLSSCSKAMSYVSDAFADAFHIYFILYFRGLIVSLSINFSRPERMSETRTLPWKETGMLISVNYPSRTSVNYLSPTSVNYLKSDKFELM
ncbi:hypothetical protein RRG08_014580 [Elysia crispata]|uniref:Uncharacterized protein n=1 Tax=Elysia crispata TaxID=231223 RepID=A0AAE1D0M8_9GAST|nr:hypothetical protein RRG08_014580 [Elysia crispata]